MGDHVTAIAEQVVYLVTGDRPTEDPRHQGRYDADPQRPDKETRFDVRVDQATVVLVVEDELAQREVLSYNLEAEGFPRGQGRKRRGSADPGG